MVYLFTLILTIYGLNVAFARHALRKNNPNANRLDVNIGLFSHDHRRAVYFCLDQILLTQNRTIILTGDVLFALANVLVFFSHALWQFILTQGLLLGGDTYTGMVKEKMRAGDGYRFEWHWHWSSSIGSGLFGELWMSVSDSETE